MEPISIVVADDHPVVLQGVTDVLTSNSDMTVVSACSDGTAALEAIRQLAPTIAVLDGRMPGLSGFDVVASISAERCPTKVVLLIATATNEQLLAAIAAGTNGIVLKEAAISDLVQCVRRVAAGGKWLPSALVDVALTRDECTSLCEIAESLTSRERQIVLMVAGGLSNKDVARRLDLSEGTVKVHLHNVFRKLGVNNRTALAAMAITQCKDLEHLRTTSCQGCEHRLLTVKEMIGVTHAANSLSHLG